MPKAIFEVEETQLTVSLYENFLRIDLKGSLKNEVEEALENKPILKDTIGRVLSMFVPLHIRLSDVDSVRLDEKGKLEIALPNRRNVLIPLGREDAERLSDKLNELIPEAKKQEWERRLRGRERTRKKRARKHARVNGGPPSSYVTMPYYFPTEQVDNVPKLQRRKKRKRRVH
jgi:hypothetical protein